MDARDKLHEATLVTTESEQMLNPRQYFAYPDHRREFIDWRAKYHKLLYNYADEEAEESSLDFVREERGPYDPGLSKAMQRYMDLGLIDVDDDEEPHEIEETAKGERYMSGYERTKTQLDTKFKWTKEWVANTVKKHGEKSANEMVQPENIQEAKQNPTGKKLK